MAELEGMFRGFLRDDIDLVCARAAQAKAAYASDEEVDVKHVGEVAEMVYAHRVHSVPFGKGGPNLGEVISRMVGQS